ncbi:S-adenosyl-L-methionine-dependent methyltransferase [Dichomitus squalens]|uniref:Histone-lysine N-methyltransferase, H3 lysine-79 specific n=1 Tax=Dichomitus squalens TaxID=114155 RepID=A0A4Q9MED6_9APHY|nr:S-adenosyl-L-methionine-dependent methyltransferase [Dichomitus squalens]
MLTIIRVDFKNPDDPDDTSFEPHPTDYPVVYLEYPNNDAQESFVLLAPKDKDHYNPIMCLESTLHTIIAHYLTPAQAALFGTLPDKDVTDDDEDDADDIPERSKSVSPYPVSEAPSPPSSEVSPHVDYLRLLQRAIKKRDGPMFMKVMSAINALLSLLKYPPLPLDPFDAPAANHLGVTVRGWQRIPTNVVHRIADETYQRAVGPHIDVLKRYEAFSSEVYGELMPTFVSDVIRATGLHGGSLFLDMGSGVGNVVMQASLETGCRSYGIEIMPGPAQIARSQLEQFKTRCRMWGVRMGEVELEEGDMLKSAKVDELVKSADVVLVNNKVFLEPLNEALRQKFLDLKEGAIVVSLKCLMGSGRSAARERSASPALKERNLDDISEIFTVTARPYYPGSVSWGGAGGEYFLQRMNREDYARRKMLFESSRAGSGRVTRSRR